ncbi:MAG: hypothetical protein U1F17_07765 [Burkholderiaceae bacterium]
MMPRSPDDAGAERRPAARFGARLGGVGVALPPGTPLEFVADAAIYPLPLAPARVAGLMHLRGQPLVVLDPSAEPVATTAMRRRDVLVVGKPPQAAALLVDGPPQALVDGSWQAGHERPPDCPFVPALDAVDREPGPRADAGEVWYEADPERLFEALARS